MIEFPLVNSVKESGARYPLLRGSTYAYSSTLQFDNADKKRSNSFCQPKWPAESPERQNLLVALTSLTPGLLFSGHGINLVEHLPVRAGINARLIFLIFLVNLY